MHREVAEDLRRVLVHGLIVGVEEVGRTQVAADLQRPFELRELASHAGDPHVLTANSTFECVGSTTHLPGGTIGMVRTAAVCVDMGGLALSCCLDPQASSGASSGRVRRHRGSTSPTA